MKIMCHLALKYLKENKKRTFVSLLGIVISVAMVTGVFGLFTLFNNDQKEQNIKKNIFGEQHLSTSLNNKNQIEDVIKEKGIKSYGIESSCTFKTSENTNFFVRHISKNGIENLKSKLSEGNIPTSSSEIIISDVYAKNLNLKIGDTLKCTPQDDNRKDSEEESFEKQTLKIVGICDVAKTSSMFEEKSLVSYLDQNNPPKYLSHFSVGICLDNPKNAISFKENLDKILDMKDSGKIRYNSETLMSYGVFKDKNLSFSYNIVLWSIIGLILITSILIIYNIFAISITERSRDMGMISSMGASKRQKFLGALSEGFFMFFLATPIGLIIGILGIFIFLQIFNEMFIENPTDKMSFIISFYDLIVSCIVSFFTVFISSLIPAIRTSKITIINSIRGNSDIKLKKKKIKTSRIITKIFGFEGTLALKNLKRNKGKYRATLLALIFSVFLFTTVSGIFKMTESAINFAAGQGGDYPGEMSLHYKNQLTEEEIKSIMQDIRQKRGVKTVSSSRNISVNVINSFVNEKIVDERIEFIKKINKSYDYDDENTPCALNYEIMSFDDETMKAFLESIGEKFEDYNDPSNIKILSNQKAILIASNENGKKRELIDIFKVLKNEKMKIALKPYDKKQRIENKNKFKELEIKIGSFYEKGPLSYDPGRGASRGFIVTEKILEKMLEEKAKFYDEAISPIQRNIFIKIDDNLKNDIKAVIELGETIRDMEKNQNANLSNFVKDKEEEKRRIFGFKMIIFSFIGLISLICLTSVINTTSTSVILRRREFSILRAVGLAPKSFNKMIVFESLFYGIKAVLWGLPLSLMAVIFINQMMSRSLEVPFEFDFIGNLTAILSTLIFILMSMSFASKKIKKENIIDTLKLENI